MSVNLSIRMKMIAGLCRKCGVLADIGCDHAYISIYLAENGLADKVYAMDLRPGPLERAAANIETAGLAGRVSTVLSDGLENLPEPADTVIISGMGGILICKILSEGSEKLSKTERLILQPQSDRTQVRKMLADMGYIIEDEADCFDDGKYYQAILAVRKSKSANSSKPDDSRHGLKEDEIQIKENMRSTEVENIFFDKISSEFGPVLIKKKSPELRTFLESRKLKLGKIIEGLENGKRENKELPPELKEEYELVCEALKLIAT